MKNRYSKSESIEKERKGEKKRDDTSKTSDSLGSES